MATEIIKIIPASDVEIGVEIHLAKVDRGYSVTIKDTDAGEFLGIARIFPDYDRANTYAENMAATM